MLRTLTPLAVKRAYDKDRSLQNAIKVSLEAWRLKRVLSRETSEALEDLCSSDLCALCLRDAEGWDDCSCCVLGPTECCEEWKIAREAFDNFQESPADEIWENWLKACDGMIKRLEKEKVRLQEKHKGGT